MKKTLNKMAAFFAGVLLLASCGEDNAPTLKMEGDVSIHSFSINGREAVIDDENFTVYLLVPRGTDLTSMAPAIEIAEGAAVTPGSGEPQNFTSSNIAGKEVKYRVMHNDLYQDWKVTVEEVQAKITAFSLNGVDGVIDQEARTIELYLPQGTDVTALVPQVTYTEGAQMTPAPGTAVDFTQPVVFKLEYEESTFEYTVTVHLGKPIMVIYNGEDIRPSWVNIAAKEVFSPIDNPKKEGINTSDKCAAIYRTNEDTDDGGKPWSGGALWNENGVNIDPKEYGKIAVMVLKDVEGDVQLELQSAGEQNKSYHKVAYTTPGQWQRLEFDISERTEVVNSILIAPHNTEDRSFTPQNMYWDQIEAIPTEE